MSRRARVRTVPTVGRSRASSTRRAAGIGAAERGAAHGAATIVAVRPALARVLPPLVAAALLLLLAEVAIRASGVRPSVLPPPTDVLAALADDAGVLATAARQTGVEVVLGLVAAAVLGLLLAIAMHLVPVVGRGLRPLLVASQAVPIPAIAPALALWLGYTLETRVVVVALVAFFPVAVAAGDALRRADPELLDLYRSLGARPGRVLLDVELPGAVPAVFSGLRVAAAFSVVGAVLGEWVGAADGLGYLILLSSNDLRADRVFAAVVVLAGMGLALVGACAVAERRLAWWR